MMIMPTNNTSGIVHYLAGKYPGKMGLLMSPNGWRRPPWYMPYALDNGSFIKWEPEIFQKMLLKNRVHHKPLWVVVPDVVGDAKATMEMWHQWKDAVSSFGYPLAFAAQDGMEPQDVPKEAYCCFVGGTTEWKLENAHKFKGTCEWLHIGRVSTGARLRWAEKLGADSCDGTGWFRAGVHNSNNKQCVDLIEYFEGSPQRKLF